MKKLPKIYQCNNWKIKTNNKKHCIVNLEDRVQPIDNVQDILEEVFSSFGFPFNISLIIKTKNYEKETSLIGKNKNYLYTIDNEIIPIKEIISIKRKKNN